MMKCHITDISMFEQYLRDKKNLADSSIFLYLSCIGKFLARNPDLENTDDYNKFLIEHTIKKRCSHYYSVFKAFIEFKISDATIKKRIIENMIKPPERLNIVRHRRHLSENKLLEIINYLDKDKHKVIAIIQSLTGVRVGDILRTPVGNIVPEEYKGLPVLRLNLLGKRKKQYTVFIHDDVAQQMIMNYIAIADGHQDYYFLEFSRIKSRNSNNDNIFRLATMNYNWYWADLKQALQTAGVNRLDFSTHDFRRCFSRRVWEKYADVHKLQNALNHSDPKTTMRYLNYSGLQNIDLHSEMQK